MQLRGAIYFSPTRLLALRRQHRDNKQRIDASVDELNKRLRSPNCRLDDNKIFSSVEATLRKHSVLSFYTVHIESTDVDNVECWQVRLEHDDDKWHKHTELDGFGLILAHPDTERSAAELLELYVHKNIVEHNFRVIKSQIELRPINHRTDPKVRAHVSICMFALLLQRTIERKLAHSNMPMSAPACLELLSACMLNYATAPGVERAILTDPTEQQRRILNALDLDALLGDHHLEQLTAQK